MRFVMGLIVGALAALVIRGLWPTSGDGGPSLTRRAAEPEAPADAKPLVLHGSPSPPASLPPAAAPAPEIVARDGLAVGQGLVLETAEIVAGDDVTRADLVVEDIRVDGVAIRTPHGGAEAAAPLGALQLPRGGSDLSATLEDGPSSYPLDRLAMAPAGLDVVAFVRDRAGRARLVWIERLVPHDEVLRRRVHFGSRVVEAREGGGIARVPTAVDGGEELVSTHDLRWMADLAGRLPNSMNTQVRRLRKELRVLEGAGDAIAIPATHGALVMPTRIRAAMDVAAFGVAVAADADTDEAQVKIGAHGVLVVVGDLRGNHALGAHAYVHVTGDLVGTVTLKHNATLVVEGDLLGTVHQGFHTRLIVVGGLHGAVRYDERDQASHACLFLDRYVRQDEMGNLPHGGSWPRLYVRSSDLEPGEHRDVAGWKRVHVGGEFWDAFAR